MRNNTNEKSSFRVPSESLCSFNTGVLLLLRRSAQQWRRKYGTDGGVPIPISCVGRIASLLASAVSSSSRNSFMKAVDLKMLFPYPGVESCTCCHMLGQRLW